MPSPTLTDLPPELLDHITTYLPTAQSVSNLGSANKVLHAFVEKDAWQTFSRTRFPSLYPSNPPSNQHKAIARSLTTLSRAWDRRAFVARYIEPHGDIHSLPGNKKIERWKRPRGQTIGFTPQLDCFEEIRSPWRERKEVLTFSAGAEVCVREKRSCGGKQDVKWTTYRPLDAVEGRDDVTSLQLLRPDGGQVEDKSALELMTGTANGDLQLLSLSSETDTDVTKTSFTTQGLPVRSSSLSQQPFQPTLLAANLGDTRICLYPIDSTQSTIAPSSQLDIRPPTNGRRTYRAWSTNFISRDSLAIGLGPSEEPVHIYTLTPFGLSKEPLRKFSLQNELDRLEGEITLTGFAKKSTSSVYPIVPLPPSHASSGDGQVFLSGAYDGIIRLHDLRSDQEVEGAYIDPTDDSAIYSLLPRGRETLVAGTSRHSLLKVFDLRLGSKAYSYLDATSPINKQEQNGWRRQARDGSDWNLFLKPHSATYPGRGGGNNWARRSAESSIYSLTSSSPHSPNIYAGVENAVVEMAFTSILDPHADPSLAGGSAQMSGKPGSPDGRRTAARPTGNSKSAVDAKIPIGWKSKEILDLATYEQNPRDSMKLMTQRSLWDTVWVAQHHLPENGRGEDKVGFLDGLDERWKVGS